jgi:hypothetical protein
MREQRQLRERELERSHEIERRGIRPLNEYRRERQFGRDREAAEGAWARHAAEKGLEVEHIRDELLKGRERAHQEIPQRDLDYATQLAEREVKRARGIERDRGLGWSR